MAHVDERALEAVIHHQLSPRKLARIKRHVQGCHACARRLEELRDRFAEVESVIPTIERTQFQPDRDIVLMPPAPAPDDPAGPWLDYSTLLWAAAVVLAVVVGVVASRTHVVLPGRSVTTPSKDTSPVTTPVAVPVPSTAAPPKPEAKAAEPHPPALVKARTSETRRDTAANQAAATRITATMPRFRPISLEDARRLLAGPVRQVQGLIADHVEMGPGEVVPGALTGHDLIRIVYKGSDDRLLLLDQQRDRESGRHAWPDTLVSTAPTGVSVAQWWDADGYWITLAGQVGEDSLRRLVAAVR